MKERTEDELDVLLRTHLDLPLSSDGFCDRVMQQLPPAGGRQWALPAAIAAGVVLAILSLESSGLPMAGSGVVLYGGAAVCMSILAALWALSEADAG
jgi:hypothetical protein